MLLGQLFDRFVEHSPLSVMVRGLLEYALIPHELDDLFDQATDRQYTKQLLFSSTVDLMSLVVCGVRPSVHAAYQARADRLPVSLTSVYNKLHGIEPPVAAAVVRHTAARLEPVIRELGGQLPEPLPGYRLRILDGNHLAATQHRLPELRGTTAGPLPGLALVVLDPVLMQAINVFPCEDGHTQERALLGDVLATVTAREVWIDDRNFCTRGFRFGLARRQAFFVTRQHKNLPWQEVSAWRPAGMADGAVVWEQAVRLAEEDGTTLLARRIKLVLPQPTRDGERELFILTNVPAADADAVRVAALYRGRWTIEIMFNELAATLAGEIDTLCYPKAALFAFCTALAAYNVLSAVKAALRAVHGTTRIQEELSAFSVADEIAGTYRGMMIAVPEGEWLVFQALTVQDLADALRDLAGRVRLERFQKHRRGPKKPRVKRTGSRDQPHVATARLLEQRKKPPR